MIQYTFRCSKFEILPSTMKSKEPCCVTVWFMTFLLFEISFYIRKYGNENTRLELNKCLIYILL